MGILSQLKVMFKEDDLDLSKADYKLICDALHKRQRNFIAGDRMFKHYGILLDKFDRLYETASDN